LPWAFLLLEGERALGPSLTAGKRGKDLDNRILRKDDGLRSMTARLRAVDKERGTRQDGSEPRISGAVPAHDIQCIGKRIRADGFLRSTGRFLCRCPVTDCDVRHRRLAFCPDPLGITIGKTLMLPDRHRLLDLVDDLPARLKRLAALRARHSHDNGNISDLKITDTVNRRNRLNRILRDSLLHHLAQISLYARMRRVTQIRYRSAFVFVADYARKQGDTAGRWNIRDRGVYLGDGKGSLADPQHPDHFHARESSHERGLSLGLASDQRHRSKLAGCSCRWLHDLVLTSWTDHVS